MYRCFSALYYSLLYFCFRSEKAFSEVFSAVKKHDARFSTLHHAFASYRSIPRNSHTQTGSSYRSRTGTLPLCP